MPIQYSRIAYLKNRVGELEKRFSEETSEDQRKWIFWEIERAYREMNDSLTTTQVKKNL